MTRGMTTRLLPLVVAAALLTLSPLALADEAAMDAEIDHLLAAVADSGCVFIRNGKEHDARAARDHLQMKRRRGRRYYDDTEEFIERIASKSSMSRKAYRIRCGADETTAAEWFNAVLADYRAEQSELPL